jgi:hypothetical protein
MRYMPDGLPSLKTYEQAKTYAESIRPYIKGRAKGSIPLGSVRRYDRSIIRVRPDSIGLFYYSNEVIRFYPDGRKSYPIVAGLATAPHHLLQTY